MPQHQAPHPTLRVDLSPKGEVKWGLWSFTEQSSNRYFDVT